MGIELLTLKDAIETFVTYDLEHSRFPHNYFIPDGSDLPYLEGLSDDQRKIILINQELPSEVMREVIIHELIHTKHYRLGDLTRKSTEKRVINETKLTYRKLYGVSI